MPAFDATHPQLFLVVWVCRSQEQPGDGRLNGVTTVADASNAAASCVVRFLVRELEEHYLTAKADMMLAAKTKPMHGESCDLLH